MPGTVSKFPAARQTVITSGINLSSPTSNIVERWYIVSIEYSILPDSHKFAHLASLLKGVSTVGIYY